MLNRHRVQFWGCNMKNTALSCANQNIKVFLHANDYEVYMFHYYYAVPVLTLTQVKPINVWLVVQAVVLI